MNNNNSNRKHPRLDYYDYSKPGYYYVTVCVSERKRLLSKIISSESQKNVCLNDIKIELSDIGKIAKKYINGISRTYENVVLDQYIIMPDHIHLIVFIKPQNSEIHSKSISLLTIVHALKRLINKEIGYNIWQDSFYEHIIRNKDDLNNARKYIINNPLRWFYKNKQ